MTFPIFCCVHLGFGAAMAYATERRMRAEGEVLGLPLVVAMLPVGLLSFPLGALLVRYAGGWFLHGALVGDAIVYERFQLGIMLGVGVAAAVSTLLGNFFAIAMLSRERPQWALAPVGAAAIGIAITLLIDWQGVVQVMGTGGKKLWQHPVGVVSLALLLCLLGSLVFARARLGSAAQTASV